MKTTTDIKIDKTFEILKDVFSWSNPMQTTRLEKIIVSTGTGRVRKEKQKTDLIQDRLTAITGQKPAFRKARQSIASFKLREGETVGYAVTLRGRKMRDFLDRLLNISIPRMRDFRGIPESSVDEMGNLTIGIPEHIIFPETPDENMQDIFSLSITIVTSAKNKEEATKFFEHIGVPFVRKT